MCELLVRVHDNEISERGLSVGCVVVVCDDGWPWSELERTAPHWRIVKIPGMDQREVNEILAEFHEKEMTHRSTLHVDLGTLDKTFVEDDVRVSPYIDLTPDQARNMGLFAVHPHPEKAFKEDPGSIT